MTTTIIQRPQFKTQKVKDVKRYQKIPTDQYGDYDLTVFSTKEELILHWLCNQTDEQLEGMTLQQVAEKEASFSRQQGKQPLPLERVKYVCMLMENTFNVKFKRL